MTAYRYRALNSSGKLVRGVLEGDSERQVRAQLRSMNGRFLVHSFAMSQATHSDSSETSMMPSGHRPCDRCDGGGAGPDHGAGAGDPGVGVGVGDRGAGVGDGAPGVDGAAGGAQSALHDSWQYCHM